MTAVLPDRATPQTTSAGLPLFDRVNQEFADHYARPGFALLANALSADEVAAVNSDALKLCRGDYGPIHYGWWDADTFSGGRRQSRVRMRMCCGGICASTTRTRSPLRRVTRCPTRGSSQP